MGRFYYGWRPDAVSAIAGQGAPAEGSPPPHILAAS